MSRLSFVGGSVLTMDERQPLLERGSVLVEDGRIVDVVDGARTHGEVVDCAGRIVMPGFVNAHAHALEGLFRGVGGELTLLPWIERTHALMDQLDESAANVAGRVAAAEMLKSGTTTYLDPEVPTDGRFDGLVGGIAAMGIRAAVTLLIEDLGGYHHWSSRTGPRLTSREEAILERWSGREPDLSLLVGPSILSAASPALGAAIRSVADARGLRIAFHCAEVAEDLDDARSRGFGSVLDLADACHLLSERSILTHGVHLGAEDFARLASAGATLVHCPSSNAKLASGVAALTAMLEAGLRVALGTDGAVCNDSYDMFAEMRLAGLLQKAVRRDPAAVTPEQLLRMATVAGAEALGIDAGRLVAGSLADVIVVDPVRIGSWPTPNIVDSLVYATKGSNVTDVFVGGSARVRDGQLVGVDERRLVVEAQAAATAAIAAAGMTDEVRPAWLRRA